VHYHSPAVAAELAGHICRAAAEYRGNIDSAAERYVEKATASELLDHELITRSRATGREWRYSSSCHCCVRAGSAYGVHTIALEPQGASAECPLECCCVEGISHEGVECLQCERVHRSTAWNSGIS
jgi:hypothetical protein